MRVGASGRPMAQRRGGLNGEKSERPANDPNETRRGCFLPDLTGVDKASVRRRPLDCYLMARWEGGKAVRRYSAARTAAMRMSRTANTAMVASRQVRPVAK